MSQLPKKQELGEESVSIFINDSKKEDSDELVQCDFDKITLKVDDFYESQKRNDDLCPIELLPVITKQGYSVTPSIIQMSRMTAEQLKALQYFKIYNKHGQIEWFNDIDVLSQNLDENVFILEKKVQVYPDSETKPPVGSKLNRECLITLYGFQLAPQKELNNYAVAKQICEEQNAEFVKYDHKNMTLCFKVKHFTTYDLTRIYEDEEDDEDEECLENEQILSNSFARE